MSRFIIGNVLLLCSMICAAGSQVLFKLLLNNYQGSLWRWNDILTFLDGPQIFRVLLSIGMLIMGFIFWIFALSRLDLSYAYPIASSSVVFILLFGAVFLGEAVTPRMYLGAIFILAGITLLMPANS
jgi:drug/metabolite transporter (DMT)-like permease